MNRLVLSIILLAFPGAAMASDRYINIITPQGNAAIDADRPVTVSGTGKGLFEGNVVVRFEDLAGKLLVQEPTTMHADDVAAAGEWQTRITLPGPVPESIRLIAFSPSPKDGEAAITSAPVLLVTSDTTAPALEAFQWKLVEYLDESGDLQAVIADTVIDAQFVDGKISGGAGCNRYFGGYTSGPGEQLVFDDRFGSTQMACAQAVAAQEQRYLVLLSGVNSQEIHNGQLSLLDKQGQLVLRYTAESPLTLENTSWQANAINNGRGGVVSSATTRQVIAMFADGKVSGSAGCNNYSAGYQISDSQITIGPAMTTRRQCSEPEGIMTQEQEFLQALSVVSQYRLVAGRLELRDSNGSLQVIFVTPEASE